MSYNAEIITEIEKEMKTAKKNQIYAVTLIFQNKLGVSMEGYLR